MNTLKQRQVQTPLEYHIRERGLKPGWTAKKLKMSYSRLRDLRLGTSEAKASELVRMAEFFGVSMDELAGVNSTTTRAV